jgi:hypothetical protein
METNTLDHVVSSFTRRAVNIAKVSAIQLTGLERSTPEGQALHTQTQTNQLDQRYAKFDPAAMALTYEDAKLGITLPALSAFHVDAKTPSRSVFFFSEGGTINMPSYLKKGKRDFKDEEWDAVSDLHVHTEHIWEKLRPAAFGRGGRILTLITFAGAGVFIMGMIALIGMVAIAALTSLDLIGDNMGAIMIGIFTGLAITGVSAIAKETYNPKAPCYTVTFGGFIPSATRAKIEAAKPDFDNILLVCDVANAWSIDEVSRSINLDPLVIGVKEIENKKYYFLVDQFNLTKLEDHVAAEWATSPEKA